MNGEIAERRLGGLGRRGSRGGRVSIGSDVIRSGGIFASRTRAKRMTRLAQRHFHAPGLSRVSARRERDDPANGDKASRGCQPVKEPRSAASKTAADSLSADHR